VPVVEGTHGRYKHDAVATLEGETQVGNRLNQNGLVHCASTGGISRGAAVPPCLRESSLDAKVDATGSGLGAATQPLLEEVRFDSWGCRSSEGRVDGRSHEWAE